MPLVYDPVIWDVGVGIFIQPESGVIMHRARTSVFLFIGCLVVEWRGVGNIFVASKSTDDRRLGCGWGCGGGVDRSFVAMSC